MKFSLSFRTVLGPISDCLAKPSCFKGTSFPAHSPIYGTIIAHCALFFSPGLLFCCVYHPEELRVMDVVFATGRRDWQRALFGWRGASSLPVQNHVTADQVTVQ